MDSLNDLIGVAIDNWPVLGLAAGLAVVLYLLFGRRGGASGNLRRRIDSVQKRFNLHVLDKRLSKETALYELMAKPLRQWPHDPLAFYIASLQTVEEMAKAPKPITEWPEAKADQNVSEVVGDFNFLMRAIAAFPKPGEVVPRSVVKQAKEARRSHLARMGKR
jgi:hypothetical protein